MKKNIYFLIIGLLIVTIAPSCKKKNESVNRLAEFAKVLNEAPDKELSNGTLLTGCEYIEGDSLLTYIIKVSDNRYDKLEEDSIKRNFAKTVKSESMRKIVNLLNRSKVGLKYKLELPEKEVEIIFSRLEISDIAGQQLTK